jgi:quinol monooxygenase YgiN
MSVIEVGQQVVTMVNVFTVAPENQQRLVELIVEATETVMRDVDGFVSANIHSSLDGTRVVNYAQWRSVEHFEAMHRNPLVHPHFTDIRAIASPEMHLYRVDYVEEVAAVR